MAQHVKDQVAAADVLIALGNSVLEQRNALTSEAALELAQALGSDLHLLVELEGALTERGLIVHLLDLPQRLSLAGEHERALSLADAFRFVAPDDLAGEAAVILARSGQREQALARVEANLAAALDRFVAEAKAGDAYRALGEDDAALVYYQRSLAEAGTRADRSAAALRITSFLLDSGREADADAFVKEQRRLEEISPSATVVPTVGRNEPCPCGSGKKYKKCHGASP